MAPKAQRGNSPGGGKRGKKKHKPLPDTEEEEPLNMESMGHPEIYPIVLTTKTQEIFNCRIDEDITDEVPYKLIKKEAIFEDLHNRDAVSDFHPVKKIVQAYPGDELLLVYDKDFKYGLNFYLIGTEEGKENYLNPPEVLPEEQEENKELIPEDIYVYQPPVSKPWVSLGSEKEIEEESVKESTKQIIYMISRKRNQFGAPVTFSDQNASSTKDAYIDCTAYPDKNFTLKKLEKDIGMTYPKNATTQYYAREFSEEEREKLGQSKTLIDFLKKVSTSVEIALQQNEIMNTFIEDWKCLAEEEGAFGDKTDTHLKEYQSFTDLHSGTDKMISYISWHPTIYGLIAVSMAERLSFEERVQLSGKLLLQPSLILFWSFSDPIHPQLMLESPDDIICFNFCPSDPNIIAGGCINGQIVLWDITTFADHIENIKASGKSKKVTLKPMFLLEPESPKESNFIRHCAVSSIESGHKKIITDIHWLPDTFEEGEVIYTDWKLERDPDTGRFMTKKPVNIYTVHDGAVHTVQRSPFYNDIVLTIAKQQFIAIADYYGTLHILEIPWTLSHPSINEIASVNHYFEREVKHLEYVEQRKNIREQEKREMELEMEKKKFKIYQMSKEQAEAELKLEYEAYLELEKSVLINLGLAKETEKVPYIDII
ncbi:Hypothetical predicted protein [Marmota monax]|uniref:WD repeat-containing protein 63 n=1 Tax=Marmota monax TaxID=9995 RepID=A0A5E4CDB6_MARMO|nr:Hypothetical predicted protein [Marmota monax]